VKWEFERRLPVRYTASNSPRRTIRASRGNSRPPGLLGREPMASLLAARRQHLAASDGLHPYAKSVRLRSPPFSRLICSLWQSNPPLFPSIVSRLYKLRYQCSSGVGALAPIFRARKNRALAPEEALLVRHLLVRGAWFRSFICLRTPHRPPKRTAVNKPHQRPIPNQ
jgi:hypothetical protein